jgi:hypothetical protein
MGGFSIGIGIEIGFGSLSKAGNFYYVDSVNGDDGNAGTSAAPFASLTAALAVPPKAGDTIFIARGSSFSSLTLPFSGLSFAAYGAGADITITSLVLGGFTAQFNGILTWNATDNTWANLDLPWDNAG